MARPGGVPDGGGNRGGGACVADLAGALDAEGDVRFVVGNEVDFDIRYVGVGGDVVSGKVGV